ncbi:MAG: UDP-N-acetylmuramoyl-L-alanyl-D-glutamate--2,6-diaminopimelate ligase [Candidatus Binatia bacterium]|nr:UDP-N-acetylmuramoyl-L-alanyl-D-glutamate--2,6-diaminopimelate ligase [Candidatus Binatia bacterium]
MMLRDLLPPSVPLHVEGTVDLPISQLAYDSRCVQPGALFFALPGSKVHGAQFISQAIARGACAVVVPPATPVAARVTTITTAAPRVLLGLVADRFYGRPSTSVTLVGVTGTSGKTTTTYLLEAIWQTMGWMPGVIGTVNYRYGDQVFPAPFTTPEAVELQALLAEMVAAGVKHVAMEVSSHALVQERVRGCAWDGAVFTNLGRDHLDFHSDLEDYFAAKSRLFLQALADSEKADRFAVINADDPWGRRLLSQPLSARVLTYGLQSGVTVSARAVEADARGLRGVLRCGNEEVPFSSTLIGEPHLYNILAAAAAAFALGIPTERVAAGIARCTLVPGRLEKIEVGQPFTVLVDYAHKPDALEKTLLAVRRFTVGRLITVFGCGGDRDRGKRPLMGEVVGRLSDIALLTSDNPRTEDPWQILAEVEPGLMHTGLEKVADPEAIASLRRGYVVLQDRREAIRAALAGAQPGDTVVVAGKGHEDYQIIGTTKYHFDDREEVRAYLKQRYSEEQR